MTETPETPEDREPDVDADVQAAQPTAVAVPIPYGTPRLPRNGNVEDWSPAEKATVEAAGLVFTYPDYHELRGQKVLAPRPIVERFLAIVQRTGLDPLARQIYCIPRLGRGGIEWSVQTGIDGFRVVAERSKLYQGREPFQWMTADGQWVEAFVPKFHGEHPLAARAAVWRSDWPRPTVAIAEWEAYKQTTSKGELTAMWKKQGAGQLAKCAEALALRTAFPQDLSGVYTDDETAGTQAAIDQDRAAEIAPYDWSAEINACNSLDDLFALRKSIDATDAGPAVYALLIARQAILTRDGDLQGTEPADGVKDTHEEPVPVAATRPARAFNAAPMGADTTDDEIDPEIADYEAEQARNEREQ